MDVVLVRQARHHRPRTVTGPMKGEHRLVKGNASLEQGHVHTFFLGTLYALAQQGSNISNSVVAVLNDLVHHCRNARMKENTIRSKRLFHNAVSKPEVRCHHGESWSVLTHDTTTQCLLADRTAKFDSSEGAGREKE